LELKAAEEKATAIVSVSSLLSETQKGEIGKIVRDNFGANRIEFEVDPSLIGGLKIKIGSEVLDLSTQSKLDQLIKSI
jgi:F-type H+-transporting ATPase subunit delta